MDLLRRQFVSAQQIVNGFQAGGPELPVVILVIVPGGRCPHPPSEVGQGPGRRIPVGEPLGNGRYIDRRERHPVHHRGGNGAGEVEQVEELPQPLELLAGVLHVVNVHLHGVLHVIVPDLPEVSVHLVPPARAGQIPGGGPEVGHQGALEVGAIPRIIRTFQEPGLGAGGTGARLLDHVDLGHNVRELRVGLGINQQGFIHQRVKLLHRLDREFVKELIRIFVDRGFHNPQLPRRDFPRILLLQLRPVLPRLRLAQAEYPRLIVDAGVFGIALPTHDP